MSLDYKAIGKRVKIARIRKDISQETLAEMIGMSNTHISNIETGNTKLSLPTIVQLANALDVSVDAFLCDSVYSSHHIFQREADELLQDCSEYEVRVLVDILKAAKETLRKNKVLERG